MVSPNLAVGIFILSSKKPHVDIEMDVNQRYVHPDYIVKSSFAAYTAPRIA